MLYLLFIVKQAFIFQNKHFLIVGLPAHTTY